tara:strand:+ start:27 stop:482 length:456 start_codon:yes stop_codon:yes gene_type:complete
MNQKTSTVFQAPSELSDDKLLERLLELQQRTRGVLMKYKLRPASFSVMARQARQSISNTEELSELFELLINLQELGTEAKLRKVLNEASMTQSGEQSQSAVAATSRRRNGPSETGEAETTAPAERPDEIRVTPETTFDEDATRDFFSQLDK